MQRSLFDLPLTPTDPNVLRSDVPRLSRQCEAILARLRQGRASNKELAGIALKYTGRLSDLRKHGHSVVIVAREPNGVVWYEIQD